MTKVITDELNDLMMSNYNDIIIYHIVVSNAVGKKLLYS